MGRFLSPALWQHAVRKEKQKVVPQYSACWRRREEEEEVPLSLIIISKRRRSELLVLGLLSQTDHNRVSV